MPTQVIEYKCLLISPGDVAEERHALNDLISYWNAQVGRGLGTRINLVRWESHSVPDLGMPAQEAINAQLVRECDLGIAVFWWKMGTPTENHPSGSAEEIFELLQKGSRVLVYFCNRAIPQTALRDNQFTKLQGLKDTIRQQGLYAEYSDVANLREQVMLHLTNVISQMLAKDRGATQFVPSSGTVTAPTPDVRVTADSYFETNFSGRIGKDYVAVIVENHSPVTVYLSSVGFEMADGKALMVMRDAATKQFVGKVELASGNSHTQYFDPESLRPDADRIVCAHAVDAVGHVWRSDQKYFKEMLRSVLERK